MSKTKHNKRRITNKTKKIRKYKKYYGGTTGETLLRSREVLKEDTTGKEGVIDIIGNKFSGYASRFANYGKEKALRLFGLKQIEEGEAKTNNSSAFLEKMNNVLESPEVQQSVSDTAADLAETGTKLFANFNEVANTPEFKEQTKVAVDNAAEIAEIVIHAADKPINDTVDVLNEAGTKAISGIASGTVKAATDVAAAVPFYGSIIDMGKMVNDVTAAAQDVVSASRTATEAVSKAVKETNENINEGLEKLEESKHRAENITNSMPFVPKVNNMPSTSNLVQAAGGLKKIHNVKHQVAGRIMDSMYEFSDPVNYSILKGSDNKTKKHLAKSRGKSKRVRFQL
jgi:hypothetical protein